jgi:hypothetical protein
MVASGATPAERAPTGGLSPLQRGGDLAVGGAEVGADASDDGDGDDCDQGRNQCVLDRGDTGLVPREAYKERAHWAAFKGHMQIVVKSLI